MRLFYKVFICVLLVLSLSMGAIGFSLISSSYRSALERETKLALDEHELLRFGLQITMSRVEEPAETQSVKWLQTAGQIVDLAPYYAAIHENDEIASSFPDGWTSSVSILAADTMYYKQEHDHVVIGSVLIMNDRSIELWSAHDISPLIMQRQSMLRSYQLSYLAVIAISILILCVCFWFLTRPIRQLADATTSIAAGNYGQRVKIRTKDEIGMLGDSFNHMADMVETKVAELAQNAERKEEFIANFAHELKTPMTSVIGYADRIYQKELSREATRDAASYIIREGMRLEALSKKLLELSVINRMDFPLSPSHIDAFIEEIVLAMHPALEKSEVSVSLNLTDATVEIDNDLLRTMMMNLLDNAIKAGATQINLDGVIDGLRYRITLSDDGRGIRPEHLSRIMEPFYSTIKARSKEERGFGLGLSISKRIAEIHGTQLSFESVPGKGTTVSFFLPLYGGIS